MGLINLLKKISTSNSMEIQNLKVEILNEIEYKKKYREIYSIIRLIRDYK